MDRRHKALDELIARQHKRVLAQPPDPNHTRLTIEIVNKWAPRIGVGGDVLDVGCGQAVAKAVWEANGFTWHGATIGPDAQMLKKRSLEVQEVDMHALSGTCDVVYARHILEHSPAPAVALRVWRELAPWLIVVVPAFWSGAFKNVGHISVLPAEAWRRLMRFVGLNEVDFEHAHYNNPPPWGQEGGEYRFLLGRT